jgi:hypothetical protein
MKGNTRLLTICLGLSLIAPNATFGEDSVVTFNAKCEGGSLPLAYAPLVVRITADQLQLLQGGTQFAIPISNITLVAHSDAKAKRYLVGIKWAGLPGEVILAIERQDHSRVVAILGDLFERANLARARP